MPPTGRARRRPALLAAQLAAALGFLCGLPGLHGEEPPAPPAADRAVDALRALPYLRFGRQPADPSRSGVVRLERGRRHPGYDLILGTVGERLVLQSATGRGVHSWRIPRGERWVDAQLDAAGDLWVLAESGRETPEDPIRRFVVRRSWRGFERSRIRLNAHHTFAQLPDGGLLLLTSRTRPARGEGEAPVLDNLLVALDRDGKARGLASLFDLLTDAPDGPTLLPVVPRARGDEPPRRDLLHANAVAWLAGPRDAAPADVLVTLRHQDLVAAIDWRSRRLVWHWGRGVLSGPHDASLTSSGHLLVFDNGLASGRSRVLEVDVARARAGDGEEAVVWRYPRPGRDDLRFFTASGGACQRLANGNTLIVSTNQGRAFEVTRDGAVVWDFHNPTLDRRGHRGTLTRVRRYDAQRIQALLASHRD